MLVYLITNTVNGKQYIGQTRVSLHRRWLGHKSSHHTRSPLHSAIQKYGAQAFCLSLLDTAHNLMELNKKEIEYIEAYQTTNPAFGYNLHGGGNTGGTRRGIRYTPEAIEKIKQARARQKPIKWSAESKKNFSLLAKKLGWRPPNTSEHGRKAANARWNKGERKFLTMDC